MLGQRGERTGRGQRLHVAHIKLRPLGHIGHGGKATPAPRIDDARAAGGRQALDHQQTQAHRHALTGRLERARISARLHIDGARLNAMALRVLQQLRRLVKAHGLAVEQRRKKGRRLVALEPGRHIGEQGEAGRMRFGKTVIAKAQYLLINGLGEFGLVATLEHAADEPRLKVREAALALPGRHGAAQMIGLTR